jgi:hypothetical protein
MMPLKENNFPFPTKLSSVTAMSLLMIEAPFYDDLSSLEGSAGLLLVLVSVMDS